MYLKKIISGGQSGADQAGLDAAIESDMEHGGFCPAGRKSELGPIPEKYQLTEMGSDLYHLRTEKNVMESDATIIFTRGKISRGSKLTRDYCRKHNKHCLHIDFTRNVPHLVPYTIGFLNEYKIETLNIAGQRLTSQPGIYRLTFSFLIELIQTLRNEEPQASAESKN